jgi:hypothetical protein
MSADERFELAALCIMTWLAIALALITDAPCTCP